MNIHRPSWVKKASLKHQFNAELRWVTRRPFFFRNWELVDSKTTWSTFDTVAGKDKAIAEVNLKGRTFWVEAYRSKPTNAVLWILIALCAASLVLLWLALILILTEATETTLIFHTVDPRVNGRDPHTMTYVKSRKDFKRVLEMRQPLVLTDA